MKKSKQLVLQLRDRRKYKDWKLRIAISILLFGILATVIAIVFNLGLIYLIIHST